MQEAVWAPTNTRRSAAISERVGGIVVVAKRSLHLRMDKLEVDGKAAIERAVPYSLLVESSEPIIVQMSRLDTTQNNMAFLSTMAYAIDTE